MPSEPSTLVRLADVVSAIMYGIASLMLLLLGTFGIVATIARVLGTSPPTDFWAPTVVLLFSILCLTAGFYVNPSFRRRINRRRSVTQFGRSRMVDERVLHPSEGRTEHCVACGSAFSKGLVRRFREELCVAGIPVYNVSEGHNHYCLDCATTDVPSTTRTDDRATESGDESESGSLVTPDRN